MIGRTMGNLYRGYPRADDNLIPAEDVLNKNPSHVALGKKGSHSRGAPFSGPGIVHNVVVLFHGWPPGRTSRPWL